VIGNLSEAFENSNYRITIVCFLSEIRGPSVGGYEDYYPVGCNAVQPGRFVTNILKPLLSQSSGLEL
jgi:hypothetical protein